MIYRQYCSQQMFSLTLLELCLTYLTVATQEVSFGMTEFVLGARCSISKSLPRIRKEELGGAII